MRQHGNQLYAVGAAILVLVVIAAAGLLYLGRERAAAFSAGETAERARWQKREVAELAAANSEILRLQGEARAKEQQAAEVLAALAGLHEEEMDHVQVERDRFMDDLAAGRVRFYARSAGGQGACSGAGPDASAAASRGDGEARAELSEPVSRAVAGGARLAAEADEVVLQLQLAQGTIEEYRRTCR